VAGEWANDDYLGSACDGARYRTNWEWSRTTVDSGRAYEHNFESGYLTCVAFPSAWTPYSPPLPSPFPRLKSMLTLWYLTENWQPIDFTTMIFPAEFCIDYVRVYQRKGQTNVGCDPQGFPTATYINNHLDAYSSTFGFSLFLCRSLPYRKYLDANLTTWSYPIPSNSLVPPHISERV